MYTWQRQRYVLQHLIKIKIPGRSRLLNGKLNVVCKDLDQENRAICHHFAEQDKSKWTGSTFRGAQNPSLSLSPALKVSLGFLFVYHRYAWNFVVENSVSNDISIASIGRTVEKGGGVVEGVKSPGPVRSLCHENLLLEWISAAHFYDNLKVKIKMFKKVYDN